MNIIILGAGKVGTAFAEHFARENNNVTVVDKDVAQLTTLNEHLDIRTVVGHASYPNVLRLAGADEADLLIAVTSQDETNMVACQMAYSIFNVPRKIARVRQVQYSSQKELFQSSQVPIDVLISPGALVTEEIRQSIIHPDAEHVLDFSNGLLQLVTIKAKIGGELIQKQIRNIKDFVPQNTCSVVAIYRNKKAIPINEGSYIYPGDEIYFLSQVEFTDKNISLFRPLSKKPKRIIIAGGGNIGTSLAIALEDTLHVKVIESEHKVVGQLANSLQKAIILHGDAVDSSLLTHENTMNTDVFCAVTNSDEINMVSCMLARSLGAKKTIAIINNDYYYNVIQSHIDVIVSPQSSTISSLLSHIRRGDVEQVHSLKFGDAEVMEVIVHGSKANSFAIGKRIDSLELPDGSYLGALIRGHDIYMHNSDAEITIQEADHIILFLQDKKALPKIESLFNPIPIPV